MKEKQGKNALDLIKPLSPQLIKARLN